LHFCSFCKSTFSGATREWDALYYYVQSLKSKTLGLDVLLQDELSYVNVLCFTEHWQREQQIGYTNFTQFELANSFCRVTSGHGGACIYVKKCKETREVHYFQNMSEEKNFEMAVIELSECKITVVCIYRAPDGNFREFLSKLKLVIQKLSMKGRQLSYVETGI
jgi:hypothetical protein